MVLEVYFKKPILLGENVKFCVIKRGISGGTGMQFTVTAEKSELPNIIGTVCVLKNGVSHQSAMFL
jgi:hypothetical protein